MAKGSRGRTYNRDARGRFASGSSSGPAIRRGALNAGGGTAKTRGSLGRSKAKLSAKQGDTSYSGTLSRRAQQGAVTRGKKALAEAKKAARVRLAIGPKKGTIAKPKGLAKRRMVSTAKPTQASAPKPVKTRGTTKAAKPAPRIVVPAVPGKGKLVPLNPQRQAILNRAEARSAAIRAELAPLREALVKAENAAIPARSPLSRLTDKQRKSRLAKLDEIERQIRQLEKRSRAPGVASLIARGFAGVTKSLYDRYDNTERESKLGPQSGYLTFSKSPRPRKSRRKP